MPMRRAINCLLIAVVLYGCNHDPTSGPTIVSFTPTQARPGETVTITGRNLRNSLSVSFGGTPAASFSIIESTTVTAIVGSGSTGEVKIIASNGSASLPGFIF